jgi:hypothetical protein
MQCNSFVRDTLAKAVWQGPDPRAHPQDISADKRLRRRLLLAVAKAEENLNSPNPRPRARSPEQVLASALAKAERMAQEYVRRPFSCETAHERELHRHRRRVAGFEQECRLFHKGKDAYAAEERARRLILLGHGCAFTFLFPARMSITPHPPVSTFTSFGVSGTRIRSPGGLYSRISTCFMRVP